jgi:FkbM family methyltransferase
MTDESCDSANLNEHEVELMRGQSDQLQIDSEGILLAEQQLQIDRLRTSFYSARRRILETLVPERVWPETVSIDGVNIQLRGAPYSFGVKRILKSGQYELPERKLADGILVPGMTVIEMGSSIGILTAVMAERVGETGTIVAVEASEKLTRYSRTWLEKAGVVKVVCGYGFPVWEVPKGLDVGSFDSDTGSLGGTVNFTVDPTQSFVSSNGTEVLDLKTLCGRFSLTPDALVIDVEGSERLLISCAPRLPLSVQHILIELHPWLYAGGNRDMELIANSIRADGFELQEAIGSVHHFRRAQ